MTQLSAHFGLEEMTFSSTAIRMGIDNDAPLEVVANLKRTANGLERVRQLVNNNAVHINSGYRCEALERKLCAAAFQTWCLLRKVKADDRAWADYFATKQHPTGNAVDFTTPYGPPEQIVRLIKNSGIEYDQLINEFNSWTHISFSDHPRRMALTIDKFGSREFA